MHGTAWSHDDDAMLIQLRVIDRARVPAIAAAMERSIDAVYARCAKLNTFVMVRKDWSADDETRLRGMFGRKLTCAAMARELDRTVGSVRWKMEELGLSRPEASGRWSETELDILKLLAANSASMEEMVSEIGRSAASVKSKLVQLGLLEGRADWSDEDDAVLRGALDAKLSVEDLAEQLERTVSAVRSRAAKLGIRLSIKGSAWLEADETKLREALAAGVRLADAALSLGRTPRATRLHAVEMGLLEKVGPRHLTDEVKAGIAEAAKTMPVTAAAKALGHDLRTLKLVAAQMGFAFQPGRATKAAKPKPVRQLRLRVKAEKARVVAVKAPKAVKPKITAGTAGMLRKPRGQETVAPVALREAGRDVPRQVSALASKFLRWRESVL